MEKEVNEVLEMSNDEKKEDSINKMVSTPVKKLLVIMGVPIILSMILQAVYNIVDSAFVSNMAENGEEALNALTLAFPLQMLMVAMGIGTGVGTNALVSRCLGQNDGEKASLTAGNALFLAFLIYIVFLLFAIFGVRAYISSQTSNQLIKSMAVDYLNICCIWSFGIIFFSIYEKLLQASGYSIYSTIAQVTGAVVNIILDPIMIYGLLGVPEFGVKGAAYATVIGQIISFLCAIAFHIKVNKEITNKLSYMKPSAKIIGGIYSIGLPAIIAQALMSVMTYGLNIILETIGESMVTAYGLYYKIQQFILFAAFGLRDAITPVISFNYGMGSRARIKDGIKYGMWYTLVIMFAGFAILEIFAVPFAKFFGLSGETQKLCISAIRIISVSFIFAGANIAFQGVFQALNAGIESLVISVCRQFIFIFPAAWGFTQIVRKYDSMNWLVWITFIIAEAASVAIACLLMKRLYAKKIATLSCLREQ